jgi:hypothetical protein
MAAIVIFNWDAGKAIPYKPKNFAKPSYPVTVAIDPPPEIVKLIGEDALLHQRIVDAVREEFIKVGRRIDPKLWTADEQVGLAPTTQAKKDVMEKFAQFASGELRFGQTAAEHATKTVWESLAEQRSEYKKYKLKMGLKIGTGTLGAGLGALGVAGAAATGGASLALGVVSLVRGAVDLGKTLNNTRLEAESVGKRLHSILDTLRKRYKPVPQAGVTRREVGASVVNAFTQAEVANISKAKADSDLWKNKLAGVRDAVHKLSIQLHQILEKSELLEKELLGKAGDPRAAKALAALDKLRKQIAGDPPGARIQIRPGLLDAIPKQHERAEKGLAAQKLAEQGIQQLQLKSAAWTETFDKYFGIAVNLGLAAYGDVSGGISAASATDEVVKEWTLVGLTTANDLASTTTDVFS